MSQSNKPLIGWKACEAAFYLDGLMISASEAMKHWREGTARFLPNAEKRVAHLVRKLKRYPEAEWNYEPRHRRAS
jgi:hypothetical protein